MSRARKLYWDTTCFICFLNRSENERRLICQDILFHAKRKDIELWTSTFTIAEVVRPRREQRIVPLPAWANAAIKALPKSEGHIREIWDFYQRNTAPWEKLDPQAVVQIAGMFEWNWLQKIIVDERTAKKAAEISRDFGLKPQDSIHAACAYFKKVDAIQHWDRDYDKISSLIPSEEPYRISPQSDLIEDFRRLGPHPDDFGPEKSKYGEKTKQEHTNPAQFRANAPGSTGDTPGTEAQKTAEAPSVKAEAPASEAMTPPPRKGPEPSSPGQS